MEYLTMEEAQGKFGSKGKTNAGLTLGIIGTALGALGGGFGNILGGGTNTDSGVCATPSLWEICEKQGEKNTELTSAFYQSRIKTMEDLNSVYQAVNTRLIELEKKDAAITASLPLAMQLASSHAERYVDNKLEGAKSYQNDINFVFQRELDKKINGTIGLPWADIITGIPKMPNCTMGVTCPSTPA